MIRVKTTSGAQYEFDNDCELVRRTPGEDNTQLIGDAEFQRVISKPDLTLGERLVIYLTSGHVITSTPIVSVIKE